MSSPYCKTCHNAGKSYTEYTNHWTRDKPGPDGTIICPTILNSLCSYCNEVGHWKKYCPALIRNKNYYASNKNTWANRLKKPVSRSTPNLPLVAPSKHDSNINTDIDVSVTPPSEDNTRPPSPDYPPPAVYPRPGIDFEILYY